MMSMKEGENDDGDDGKKPHAHTNDGNGNGNGDGNCDGTKKKKIKKLPPTSNNSEITSASASASAIQIPSVEATMVPEKLPTASAVVIPSYPTTSFTHTNTNTNTNTSSSNTTSSNPATIRVMAPDTLYAGSVFEAQVNMNTFMVTVPYGGVTEGDMFDVPYPTSFTNTTSAAAAAVNYPVTTDSVQVMAPSTMNEGQMFEAQVNGIKFMVTVPKNGINEGELFTVPYPTTATTIGGGEPPPLLSTGPTAYTMTNVVNAYDIPTTDGRWRTDICDCCPADNCCLCCMGFFCTTCVMAQLIQRMKYNFAGVPVQQPNGTGYKNVCMVISIITIIVSITASIIIDISPSIGSLIFNGWFLYLIIIFTCARYSMRKEYNIKSLCCNNGDAANDDCCGVTEDFCLVYWCSCCSAIQMIAHTHDGKKYPYNPCNQTGLDTYAPDIHIAYNPCNQTGLDTYAPDIHIV